MTYPCLFSALLFTLKDFPYFLPLMFLRVPIKYVTSSTEAQCHQLLGRSQVVENSGNWSPGIRWGNDSFDLLLSLSLAQRVFVLWVQTSYCLACRLRKQVQHLPKNWIYLQSFAFHLTGSFHSEARMSHLWHSINIKAFILVLYSDFF